MKIRTLLLCTALLFSTVTFSQLMSFGFVKNCMTFAPTTVTHELFKKHFSIIDRSYQEAGNPLLTGSTYYSNEADKIPGIGQISVLAQVSGKKKIVEISFINGSKNSYTKNFEDVYKQMVSFFKNERSFKSLTYNVDVNTFEHDKVFYYIYKLKNTPVIVVSNYKLEEDCFGKK